MKKIKYSMKIQVVFIAIALLLLSSCVAQPSVPSEESLQPKESVVIGPGYGGRELSGLDYEFQDFLNSEDLNDRVVGFLKKGGEAPPDSFFDHYRRMRQIKIVTLSVYWLENGGEVCYAVSSKKDIDEEALWQEILVYARAKGLKASFVLSDGFIILAMDENNPEFWMEKIIELHNGRPEFDNMISAEDIQTE